jgi:hypothetical protein
MEKIDVFQNENAKMVYYPELKIVHNTFHGKPTGKQFREALDAGVEVMKKYGATKWLSDDRQNQAQFSDEDNVWADSVWFPRMQEVGWKTWAMVVPESVAARDNVVDIIDKIYDQGVRISVFVDLDEALKWLSEME